LAFPIDIDRRPYNTLALPCECVMTFKLVYYRAPVSAGNVALLSCMYVLLCKFILVTVQINIHSFIKNTVAPYHTLLPKLSGLENSCQCALAGMKVFILPVLTNKMT